MLFNSINFVIFYIVVTTLYYVLPFKWRWALLLAASCYFYMAFVPVYILILGFTIVIDYFAGILIENEQGLKRKLYLVCSLVANISILAFFKYFNFLNGALSDVLGNFNHHNPVPYLSILLPIGLSFHTFQAMSYTIEVYRGNQKPERHFGIYSLYVMFYPQLVAGPIERPQNILPQMHVKHRFSYGNMIGGMQLMLWGFFKKLVVADRLSIFVDSVYDHPGIHNGSTVALASLMFAIQIYCDFSGYSDIAIGCAKTMGFDLMLNFRRPYFAKSIAGFWSRWHISLSTWFRDYLYIPLGGNRVSGSRMYVNLFIVFVISGIWHGANYTFIIWGLLHAVYSVFERIVRPYTSGLIKRTGLSQWIVSAADRLIIIAAVTFAWIFFRANSITDALTLIGKLKSFGAKPFLGDSINNFAHSAVAVLVLFLVEYKMEFAPSRLNLFSHPNIAVRWGAVLVAVFVILLFGVFNGGQFIYFQF